MANLPISQLPTASALTGTEVFAVVQSGTTKQTTLTSINYIPGNNYGLFNQTGSSTPITNTTNEESLIDGGVGTISVPANGFVVGDAFHAVLSGWISNVNNHDLQIFVKTNTSVVLADTGVMSLGGSTDKRWRMEINFSIRSIGSGGNAEIVTSGLFTYRKDAALSVETEIFSTINNTDFDTTTSNTLEITAQWGQASTGDSIYSQIFTLNKTY